MSLVLVLDMTAAARSADDSIRLSWIPTAPAFQEAERPDVHQQVERGIVHHLPDLYRRARQLTGDVTRADDLVQDTIERALRFKSSFRAGGYVRAWLFRIMQNVFISARRRRSTERRVLENAGVDPNGWATLRPTRLAPGLSPPVERALDRLPPRLRSVVSLVDLGEQSYKEAAAVEEVPVGTIMSRLSRGRARLAADLAGSDLAGFDVAGSDPGFDVARSDLAGPAAA